MALSSIKPGRISCEENDVPYLRIIIIRKYHNFPVGFWQCLFSFIMFIMLHLRHWWSKTQYYVGIYFLTVDQRLFSSSKEIDKLLSLGNWRNVSHMQVQSIMTINVHGWSGPVIITKCHFVLWLWYSVEFGYNCSVTYDDPYLRQILFLTTWLDQNVISGNCYMYYIPVM